VSEPIARLRRSLHFVPGGQERMLARALTLPADGLILDLEDAVPPERKAATRPEVRGWLERPDWGGRERWVRMNPVWSPHAEADLAETLPARPDGYVVPKPRRAEDVRRVAAWLEALEERHGLPVGSTRLVLIATETPEGLLHIQEIAAASPRIVAVSWGIEDLSAAMGLPRTRDEAGRFLDIPRYARVMCAVAAAAAGVEALDTVFTDLGDADGLRRECQEGVAMGFTGKISIHPSQIEVINAAFTPSRAEAEEALALVAAFEAHARRGAGAFAWKGQMMDQPHLTRARKIAERARRAGVL
jgi:citrate lyase subunit beta/citryl-CoA lyase